jgi:hypothetical protein
MEINRRAYVIITSSGSKLGMQMYEYTRLYSYFTTGLGLPSRDQPKGMKYRMAVTFWCV